MAWVNQVSALDNAADAQSTADGAVTDAATAQSTANSALARVPSSPMAKGAITPATGWAFSACGGYLVSAGDGRFDIDEDVTDSAPAGWGGILQVAKMSNGPDVIAASDRAEFTHAANTATTASNAPVVYRDIDWQPGIRIATFIGADDLDEDNQICGLIVCDPGDQTVYARVGPRITSGPAYGIELRTPSQSPPDVSVDSADISGGLWCQLHVPDTNYVRALYNTTEDEDANPWEIDWEHVGRAKAGSAALVPQDEAQLRIGLFGESGNQSNLGAFTPWMKSLWISYPDPSVGVWGAQKRSTSATTQSFPESDLGSSSAVFGNTDARAFAGSISNTRPVDRATLEWRFTRGTTGLSGSGSWYAADAIEVQGSGRYMLIEARYTSSGGFEVASIRLGQPLISGAS